MNRCTKCSGWSCGGGLCPCCEQEQGHAMGAGAIADELSALGSRLTLERIEPGAGYPPYTCILSNSREVKISHSAYRNYLTQGQARKAGEQ